MNTLKFLMYLGTHSQAPTISHYTSKIAMEIRVGTGKAWHLSRFAFRIPYEVLLCLGPMRGTGLLS
eukprot:851887-Rhodomonas_salina.2